MLLIEIECMESPVVMLRTRNTHSVFSSGVPWGGPFLMRRSKVTGCIQATENPF